MPMTRLLLPMVLIPLLLLLASHFGAYHPLGDSLAVFRGPIALASAIAAILLLRRGARMLALMAGGLVVWSAYTVLAPRLDFTAGQQTPYVLYQKNTLFKAATTQAMLDDILEQAPDFVTLQEVSRRNRALLTNLKPHYPTQLFCPFKAVGGVALAARWPMVAGSRRCIAGSGMAAMQVETPDGAVWVVSLHLNWPYPMEQAAQLRKLVPLLKALKGPLVLGGDFNMVPWSHTMRAITEATNTRRIGVPQYSLPLKGLYTLPIDHVLAPDNSRAAFTSKRPMLGSDHYGVLARFYIR